MALCGHRLSFPHFQHRLGGVVVAFMGWGTLSLTGMNASMKARKRAVIVHSNAGMLKLTKAGRGKAPVMPGNKCHDL